MDPGRGHELSENESEVDDETESSSSDSASDDEESETDDTNESGQKDDECKRNDEGEKNNISTDHSKQKMSSSDSESSDSDDPGKSCPICLIRFKKDKPVAIPDGGCSHVFCVDCLREWSKNVATCPIDRSKFRSIIIKESPGGKEIKREKVQRNAAQNDAPEDVPEFDELWLCENCGSGTREDYLLLCDGCDLAYHYDTCLTPPLSSVPRGRWYCPTCTLAGLGGRQRRNVRHEEHQQENENTDEDTSEIRPQGRQRRNIISSDSEEDVLPTTSHEAVAIVIQPYIVPRTIQTERVRRVVARRRGGGVLPKKPLSPYFLFLQDERSKAKEDLISMNLPCNMVDVTKEVARRWSEARETTKAEYERRYRIAKTEYDQAMESIPIADRVAKPKKRVKKKTKKKSTVRRKKKSTSSSKTSTGRRKTTRRKRKSKIKVKGTKRRGYKRKTASSVGNSNHGSSVEKVDSERSLPGEGLSLFGNPDDLDYFEDDNEEPLFARPFDKPVAVIKPFNTLSSKGEEPVATTSDNLLGDIIAGQKDLLKSNKQKVTKMGEIYSKGTNVDEPKLISTTISRSAHQDKTVKKSNDPTKIKNSAKFMDRFLAKNRNAAVGKKPDMETSDNQASSIIKNEHRKREITDSYKKEIKRPKLDGDKDKSLGDIVSDIIDNIMDSPNKDCVSTKQEKNYKESDRHKKGNSNSSTNQSTNDASKNPPSSNQQLSLCKHIPSKHSHLNINNSTNEELIHAKRSTLPNEQKSSETASGIFRSFGNILEESSKQNSDLQKPKFYQPSYLPSTGKNVPNNIPKAGISSSGMYKDKLERQTVISQQVS